MIIWRKRQGKKEFTEQEEEKASSCITLAFFLISFYHFYYWRYCFSFSSSSLFLSFPFYFLYRYYICYIHNDHIAVDTPRGERREERDGWRVDGEKWSEK